MDTYKQFKKVLSSMVKSILHFFKIHRKVIFGNPPVVVEDVLGKRPEALDTVDMVLGFLVYHLFRMINLVMFTQSLERVVASKGIRVVDRSLPRLLPHNSHELFLGYMFYHPRIYPSITLQKPEYNAFALSSSPRIPLRLPPK
jgi:hypothetical protein